MTVTWLETVAASLNREYSSTERKRTTELLHSTFGSKRPSKSFPGYSCSRLESRDETFPRRRGSLDFGARRCTASQSRPWLLALCMHLSFSMRQGSMQPCQFYRTAFSRANRRYVMSQFASKFRTLSVRSLLILLEHCWTAASACRQPYYHPLAVEPIWTNILPTNWRFSFLFCRAGQPASAAESHWLNVVKGNDVLCSLIHRKIKMLGIPWDRNVHFTITIP